MSGFTLVNRFQVWWNLPCSFQFSVQFVKSVLLCCKRIWGFPGNVLETPQCGGWCLQGLRGEQTWNEGGFCPSELERTELPRLIPEPELLPTLCSWWQLAEVLNAFNSSGCPWWAKHLPMPCSEAGPYLCYWNVDRGFSGKLWCVVLGGTLFLRELGNFVTSPATRAPRLIVHGDWNILVKRALGSARGGGDDKECGALLYCRTSLLLGSPWAWRVPEHRAVLGGFSLVSDQLAFGKHFFWASLLSFMALPPPN